ncbi:MAG: K(+)-transporting ATPase subunit F [Polyangiaceae bacterium]|nr:K(+)-transporting ATPase subunit F [Polyangiaceae bacterium]
MSVLYIVGIVVAVALAAYLFFAMLKPESFE